jgi:hypothetical protein
MSVGSKRAALVNGLKVGFAPVVSGVAWIMVLASAQAGKVDRNGSPVCASPHAAELAQPTLDLRHAMTRAACLGGFCMEFSRSD